MFSLLSVLPLVTSRKQLHLKEKNVINWTWLKMDCKRFQCTLIINTIITFTLFVTYFFHQLLMDSWLRFVTVRIQEFSLHLLKNALLQHKSRESRWTQSCRTILFLYESMLFLCELVHRFRVISATLIFGRVSSPYNLINARRGWDKNDCWCVVQKPVSFIRLPLFVSGPNRSSQNDED